MPYYQAILPLVEAHQWFKNGDHPMDQVINGINSGAVVGRHSSYYNETEGKMVCPVCNKLHREHGVLEGDSICPGDYIETIRNDKKRIIGYRRHLKHDFEKLFVKVISPKPGVKK